MEKVSEWNYRGFWESFYSIELELKEAILKGGARRAYEAISLLLQHAGIDAVHEVTTDGQHAVLIFSPESDRIVAERVDQLISAAPATDGWKFFGRRQPKDVEDALAMTEELYGVNLSDAQFRISRHASGKLSVTMFASASESFDEDTGDGLAMFFLEHALGESLSMAVVQEARLRPMAGGTLDCLSPQSFVDAVVKSQASSDRDIARS